MNLPMSYRGIIQLTKKLGAKLQPGKTMLDYKQNKMGCVLTVLAAANNLELAFKLRESFGVDHPNHAKFAGLENGFEETDGHYFGWYDPEVFNTYVYNRYYKVGQRLRKYALGDTK